MWSVGKGEVRNLDFDPKEWQWPKTGMINASNFFGYTTKKGYRIILNSISSQPKFDKRLHELGYTAA